MTQDVGIYAFSGEVSRLALARVDLQKLKIAQERMTNFMLHVLGPAQFRPGTEYIADIPGHTIAWFGEFSHSEKDTALLVMVPGNLYFLVDDAYVVRPAVTAIVTNGDFTTDLAGWTDSDESGATSSWNAGYMSLLGTGTNYARRDQEVTVNEPNVEHGLRIAVALNDVVLKVGTAQGEDDYISAFLGPGNYSFSLTPTGNFWIRLEANEEYPSLVAAIGIEPAGPVAVPVPYTLKEHFDSLRYDQSKNILFVACTGRLDDGTQFSFQQRLIERWSNDSRSWGVSLYQATDGPFRNVNLTNTTITPSVTAGSTTLTASRPLFKAGHVGSLWRLTHSTQRRSATLAALSDATGHIRVSGLTRHNSTSTSPGNATQRAFSVDVTADGSWSGTVALQRSLAEPGAWADVKYYTGTVSESYDDGLDNQIIYYRLIATEYTAGTAFAALGYVGSAQNGIVRLTSVTNSLLATGDVLEQIGEVEATTDWSEGEWSDYRGWPAGTAIHDGRMGWFPGIKAHLSASGDDAYASFDDTIEGDAGPINRTVTTGGADGIRWAVSGQRLLLGTATQVVSVRSSAFDEPLTPTAFTARSCSDDGVSGKVRPLRMQSSVLYAGAANRLFKLTLASGSVDYESVPVDRLKPEMYAAGIADMAVSRKPDNALHWAPLDDGTAVLLTYNEKEQVEALTSIDTDGAFERAAVLPGSAEDKVYFLVNRTIGGVTKRFIEKLAPRSEATGGTLSKTVDSHVVYSGAPTTTVSVPHLPGKQVAVWGDGIPFGTLITLDGSGNGTIPQAVSTYVAGLAYFGPIKTVKLAHAAEGGSVALTRKKRISRVGLVMADAAWAGIRIGRDFEHLHNLPATYKGRVLSQTEILEDYDDIPGPFNGGWNTDSRVCLQIRSPYCATIMAMVIHMETNEPNQPPPRREG